MTLETIGKYKILQQIGQGGMGEVYKAHDALLNRFVAVKTVAASGAGSADLRKRFVREAQSAASLNHPNIITVHEFGEEGGVVYMAMELLEGQDLHAAIVSHSLTGLEQKLDIMEQICDGLAYAHTMEVVHRDLKPSNIHIQSNGKLKIMDFGLARLGTSDMTKSGAILGTPHYMSPEQVRGEKADTRSDIFSVGSVFYELLTNHKPFDADSLHGVLYQVLQTHPEPVRKWVPDLPPDIVRLVEKALAKDPAQRFQNGSELREALRAVRRTFGGVAEWTPTPLPVNGAVALDSSVSELPTLAPSVLPAQKLPTFPGGSPTQPGAASFPTLNTGGNRLPLLLGAGALVVAVLAVALFAWRGRTSPKVPSEVGVLAQALVQSQVELARRSQADKNYKDAVYQAERALGLDAANVEARRIREEAQRALADLEQAASEARAASERGDSEGAVRALSKVMTLDPQHPIAAELAPRLDARFRAEAEEARRAMRASRAQAERAMATGGEAFARSASLAQEAETCFQRGAFAAATQKFLESRDGFDRARRDVAARPSVSTPRPGEPSPPVVAVSETPVPAATTLSSPPPAPQATLASEAPSTVAPPTAPVDEEPAVRRVLTDYARALETKDLALFRSLKPSLTPDDERRLSASFASVRQHRVGITVLSLEVRGSDATVRVERRDTVEGKGVPPFRQTVILAKQSGNWVIRDIKN